MGETLYSAAFGLMLGSAFLTEVPSGFYVLVAWSAAAPSWAQALVVALAFAAFRALPIVTLGLTASGDEDRLFASVNRIETVASSTLPAQLFILSAIAVLFAFG